MNKVLKIGGILLVVAVLAIAGISVLQRVTQPAAAETTAPTAAAALGNIEEITSATGNVSAEQQATLTFASSGQIAEVPVAEGQQVKAGDVLARLDTESLEWQVARSRASLDTALARLEQAQQPASDADLASAKAALDSAIANRNKVADGATAEELASAQAALDSAIANYDKVKAGPTEDELASAKAGLDSAAASLQQAQAAYDRIKDRADAQLRQESLTLQNATIEYDRAKANYDGLADRPTASELASAKAQVAQAKASLAALQDRPTDSEFAAAVSQVAQAKATLDSLKERPKPEDVAVSEAQVKESEIAQAQAQSQLDDATIVAPFDGAVIAVQVREGEWATPGAPAIVLAATEPMILDVNVDELDVAQLAEGQRAYLSFSAIKDALVEGTVTYIAPSSTNVGGAVAYAVEISFDPGDLPVRLGMTADVDMVVNSAEGALLVPNRAIEADREAGRYYVTRQLPDGTIQRLEVRIGLRSETQTQIVEGLEEGDVVVLPQVPGQSSEQGFGPGQGGGMFGGQRPGGGN